MIKLSRRQFEQAVERAIAKIPEGFRRHMHNLAISVEADPSGELRREMAMPSGETMLGLYTGIPLPERSATEPPLYPDEILIFQNPLQEMCGSVEELEAEIELTIVHELAHYLGFDEDRLVELGYG